MGAVCWFGGYAGFIDQAAVPSGERAEPVVAHDLSQNGHGLFEDRASLESLVSAQ